MCVCVKQNESVRGWSILREAETDTDRETGRVWDRGEQRERERGRKYRSEGGIICLFGWLVS